MLVRLTGYKAQAGDNWTATDQVLCVQGLYTVEYPEAPICPESTLCDLPLEERSNGIREICDFSPGTCN